MVSYAGVDAGGSGSRWALLHGGAGPDSCREGHDGPPIQVLEAGVEESVGRLAALLAGMQRTGTFPVAVVGLAGAGEPALGAEIAAGVRASGVLPDPDVAIHVVGDTISGAAAALHDGPGVALFAGTGSFAMARAADGALSRVGGRGNRISDHGSGFRVTQAAAEAVLLASEGAAPQTSLTPQLCAAMRAATPQELGLSFRRCTVAEIARGFRIVVDHAASGDAVAQATLVEAANQLARLAVAAIEGAGLPRSARIVLGGGTQRAAYYQKLVAATLRGLGCTGPVGPLTTSPAIGAAMLARATACEELPLAAWIDG